MTDKPHYLFIPQPEPERPAKPEPEPERPARPERPVKPRPDMRVPWVVTEPEPEPDKTDKKPFVSVYINDVVWRGGMGATWDGTVR